MGKTYVDVSNKRKIMCTAVISVISIVLFISIIIIMHKYKESLSVPAIAALITVDLVIFLIGFWTAMQGGRTIGCFYCRNCDKEFVPSAMAYMRTAHIFRVSYLKCPRCGKKSWFKKRKTES